MIENEKEMEKDHYYESSKQSEDGEEVNMIEYL